VGRDSTKQTARRLTCLRENARNDIPN